MTTTRQRILDEATAQLLERGYSNFTIASVRDALGLSSGSMFHAFASKPALAAEVFVSGMRSYQRAAMEAIADLDEPVAAVEAWIEAHLRWVSGHRDLARFLFATQPDEVMAAAAGPLAEANDAFTKTVDDLLHHAVEAGALAPLPAGVAHSLAMGAVQEYSRRWTRGAAPVDPAALVGTFQRAAVQAMRSTLTEE